MSHKQKIHIPLILIIIFFIGCSNMYEKPETIRVKGKVADGYLVNAKVFLDKDGDEKLDNNEPAAQTDSTGSFDIEANIEDINRYPIVAIATKKNTIDLDTGELVNKDYTLKSPKDKTEFISPLTTLVQKEIEKNPSMSTNSTAEKIKEIINKNAILISTQDIFADYIIGKQNSNNEEKEKFEILHKISQIIVKRDFKVDNKDLASLVAEAIDEFPKLTAPHIIGPTKVKLNESYNLSLNLWYGKTGDVWELYENGSVIHTKNLIALTDNNMQLDTYEVAGKSTSGNYKYEIKLCRGSNCEWSNNEIIVNVIDSTNDIVFLLTEPLEVPEHVKNHKTKIIGSYPEWSVYQGGGYFHPGYLPVHKLTHINLAFAKINTPDTGEITGEVVPLDAWADIHKRYIKEGIDITSINGDPDVSECSITGTKNDYDFMGWNNDYTEKQYYKIKHEYKVHGIYKQLCLLKVKYPHLKTMVSIGGHSHSDTFYTVAKNETKRNNFAQSAVAYALKYGFNGIDINWEFPVKGGKNPSLASPSDRNNFTLLIFALRNEINKTKNLNAKKEKLILSVGAYAGPVIDGYEHNDYIDWASIKDKLDFINILSYDLHGTWDNATGHNAPLYGSHSPTNYKLCLDEAVKKIHNSGVEKNKLVLGLAFYGKSINKVPNKEKYSGLPGLGQPFEKTATGSTMNYSAIKSLINKDGYKYFWDKTSRVPYLFNANNNTFITFDDPNSIAIKTAYAKTQELGGVIIIDISKDQRYNTDQAGDLLNAIHTGYNEVKLSPLTYYEQNPATNIINSLIITNIDSTKLSQAFVEITNHVSQEDELGFTNLENIIGSWNQETGVLTFTGKDTIANYQAALRKVTYKNKSFKPNIQIRKINFTITDEASQKTIVATRDISIKEVSNAPKISNIETTKLVYTKDNSAILITENIEINDFDSTNLKSASISISNYKNDELIFNNQENIIGNWNLTTGVLTLTGEDSLINYQSALRSIKYKNNSAIPNNITRSISFFVTDDNSASSNVEKRDIDIIEYPKINGPSVIGPIKVERNKTFTLSFNMWWGETGDKWKLFENNSLVHESNLSTFNGNNVQLDTHIFSAGKSANDYTYKVELCKNNECKLSSEFTTKVINSDDDIVFLLTEPLEVSNYVKNHETKIIGFYPNWAIYDGQGKFHPEYIPAHKLTHIYLAFAKIESSDTGKVIVTDKNADTDKRYVSEGIDKWWPNPDANVSECTIEGNASDHDFIGWNNDYTDKKYHKIQHTYKVNGIYKQLCLLKAKYPHLKTIITIGGHSNSDPFYTIAADETKRQTFASHAVAFALKYGFDGIDIDWEFPVKGGATPSLASPADRDNFTLLISALRTEINKTTNLTPSGKKLILSVDIYAGPVIAGYAYKDYIDWKNVKNNLDFINIMSYDLHGKWDNATGHNAPLYGNNNPTNPQLCLDEAVKKITKDGVKKNKLVIGLAFYGQEINKVTNEDKYDGLPGLNQPFEKPATCSPKDYRAIKSLINKNGYNYYWDSVAKVPYLFDAANKNFLSFDDPNSIVIKTSYAKNMGLGGVMIWDLAKDTRYETNQGGDLLNAIHTGYSQ